MVNREDRSTDELTPHGDVVPGIVLREGANAPVVAPGACLLEDALTGFGERAKTDAGPERECLRRMASPLATEDVCCALPADLSCFLRWQLVPAISGGSGRTWISPDNPLMSVLRQPSHQEPKGES